MSSHENVAVPLEPGFEPQRRGGLDTLAPALILKGSRELFSDTHIRAFILKSPSARDRQKSGFSDSDSNLDLACRCTTRMICAVPPLFMSAIVL